jgi:hypothetical protein
MLKIMDSISLHSMQVNRSPQWTVSPVLMVLYRTSLARSPLTAGSSKFLTVAMAMATATVNGLIFGTDLRVL